MLLGFTVQNFALFKDFSIGLKAEDLAGITHLDELKKLPLLQPLTVFIGRNASGKSSFLEALQFLKTAISFNIHMASNEVKQGSFSNLIHNRQPDKYDLEFELIYEKIPGIWLSYNLIISCDEFTRPYIAYERVTKYCLKTKGIETTILLEMKEKEGRIIKDENQKTYKGINLTERKTSALNIFGHQEEYEDLTYLYYQLTGYTYIDFRTIPSKIINNKNGGHKHLNKANSNIENVVYYLKKHKPDEYKNLQKSLNKNLRKQNRINLNHLAEVENESQIRYLISFLHLLDKRPLLAFNKPDNGLYYEMTDSLVFEFREYIMENPQAQIFVSTHNANMLDGFSPKEVWFFDRINNEENNNIVTARFMADNPVVKAMYEEGVGLGSLWYSGYLDS